MTLPVWDVNKKLNFQSMLLCWLKNLQAVFVMLITTWMLQQHYWLSFVFKQTQIVQNSAKVFRSNTQSNTQQSHISWHFACKQAACQLTCNKSSFGTYDVAMKFSQIWEKVRSVKLSQIWEVTEISISCWRRWTECLVTYVHLTFLDIDYALFRS